MRMSLVRAAWLSLHLPDLPRSRCGQIRSRCGALTWRRCYGVLILPDIDTNPRSLPMTNAPFVMQAICRFWPGAIRFVGPGH
jgi:hypothetical protein